jgi:formylmethanofuran dehydrogenase subunit B
MVKALFPIGKTQWAKWNDDQRTAFNEARAEGVAYADAIQAANQTQATKKKNIFDVIEDVVETVAEVVEVATPVVAVAKTVAKVAKGKKGK